jgi:UDP-N-acetylmuramoyl-L-alanyl-D-glutamate--2,6-diaminopimelate ligase
MMLSDLLPDSAARAGARDVSGVTADSRQVKPGDVFVALAGAKTDGARFIEQALANGAVAIVAERDIEIPGRPATKDAPAFIKVVNARRALALMAAKFFPRQPRTIAAVTGTSGKTSVAAFTRQIWTALGHQAASVGTVGVVSPRRETYGSLTTPDPVALHRTLDALAGEGVTHLAIEASSHGLDQHRLDGLRVAAGAFTNLSRDHLDYHDSLESYFAAKLRLFEDLVVDGGAAVVSADHVHSDAVLAAARKRGLKTFSVGRAGVDLTLLDVHADRSGQTLALSHQGKARDIRLPLLGEFQIENALVAAGLALATGAGADGVFAAVEKLAGAKGRLEPVGSKNGGLIFIDYAHKPDALAKALEALRPYTKGKLVVLFGAGGDRDPGKRSIMGGIAAQNADRVIVTDDNPRSENPASIRAAILAAAPGAVEIADRGEAIRTAISQLREGDILLIAGKGHETGQIVGDRVLDFSDHEAVAGVLGGQS